jgi:hypothetical protein
MKNINNIKNLSTLKKNFKIYKFKEKKVIEMIKEKKKIFFTKNFFK